MKRLFLISFFFSFILLSSFTFYPSVVSSSGFLNAENIIVDFQLDDIEEIRYYNRSNTNITMQGLNQNSGLNITYNDSEGYIDKYLYWKSDGTSGQRLFINHYYDFTSKVITKYEMKFNYSGYNAGGDAPWHMNVEFRGANGGQAIVAVFSLNIANFSININVHGSTRYLIENLTFDCYNNMLNNTIVTFGWVINAEHDILYYASVGGTYGYLYLNHMDYSGYGGFRFKTYENKIIKNLTLVHLNGISGDECKFNLYSIEYTVADDFYLNSFVDDSGNLLPLGTDWYTPHSDWVPDNNDISLTNQRLFDFPGGMNQLVIPYIVKARTKFTISNFHILLTCMDNVNYLDRPRFLNSLELRIFTGGWGTDMSYRGSPVVFDTSKVMDGSKLSFHGGTFNSYFPKIYEVIWYDFDYHIDNTDSKNDLPVWFHIQHSNQNRNYKIHALRHISAKQNDYNKDGFSLTIERKYNNQQKIIFSPVYFDVFHYIGIDYEQAEQEKNTYSGLVTSGNVQFGDKTFFNFNVKGGNEFLAWIEKDGNLIYSFDEKSTSGNVNLSSWKPLAKNGVGTYHFRVCDRKLYPDYSDGLSSGFTVSADSLTGYRTRLEGDEFFVNSLIEAEWKADKGTVCYITCMNVIPRDLPRESEQYYYDKVTGTGNWESVSFVIDNRGVYRFGISGSNGITRNSTVFTVREKIDLGYEYEIIKLQNSKYYKIYILDGFVSTNRSIFYLENTISGESTYWTLENNKPFHFSYKTLDPYNWKAYIESNGKLVNESVAFLEYTGSIFDDDSEYMEPGSNLLGANKLYLGLVIVAFITCLCGWVSESGVVGLFAGGVSTFVFCLPGYLQFFGIEILASLFVFMAILLIFILKRG